MYAVRSADFFGIFHRRNSVHRPLKGAVAICRACSGLAPALNGGSSAGHHKHPLATFIDPLGKGKSYFGGDEMGDLSGDIEDLATMLDRQSEAFSF